MSQVKREHQSDTEPQGPFKIEDLASIAKISIDTIRFYQTRGLLDPPSRAGRQAVYENSHLQRLTEIRELQRSGLSLNTIRRIFSKDVEAADRALFDALSKPIQDHQPAEYMSLDELSLKTSIPKPLLQSLVNEGLISPVKINDLEVFPASDIEMARAG
ncbi:MAG: MerR family transcriptional regulator, partial [Acidimicrobiaceae bacterium]|nr:MerR family transcriptional regulator [Acidimicrobiaceae bacterium]